jgi:hypothetical protein
MISALQTIQWQYVIIAIAGLGIATFGLLDAAKSILPGISRVGFGHIKQVVTDLTPEGAAGSVNALPRANTLETLEANWVNGTDLRSQKAIAKSLIKMHMNEGNAAALAAKTNVDSCILTEIATQLMSGTPLTPAQFDLFSRFDLIVTALLDEAYQLSDQVYRNAMRTMAVAVAVALALVGGLSLEGPKQFWHSSDLFMAVLVGLLAAALAPIAKDSSTAVSAAIRSKIDKLL